MKSCTKLYRMNIYMLYPLTTKQNPRYYKVAVMPESLYFTTNFSYPYHFSTTSHKLSVEGMKVVTETEVG